MTDDQILEKLGLPDTTGEAREVVLHQLNQVVDKRLMNLVIEMLSDEQLEKAEQLQAAGDDKVIWDWLSAELTDLDKLREGILADYIDEYNAKS